MTTRIGEGLNTGPLSVVVDTTSLTTLNKGTPVPESLSFTSNPLIVTVPANEMWQVLAIQVRVTPTGVAGDRNYVLHMGGPFKASFSSPVPSSENTSTIHFMYGVDTDTEFTNGKAKVSIPPVILIPTESIVVTDEASIDSSEQLDTYIKYLKWSL